MGMRARQMDIVIGMSSLQHSASLYILVRGSIYQPGRWFEKPEDPGQEEKGFHLIARPHFQPPTQLEAGSIIVNPAALHNVRIALTQS